MTNGLDKIRGTRALVTGGAGFIGSHIATALLEHGASVVVLDNLSSGHRENLPEGVELVEACVTEAAAVERASAGCRYVFHEAAMVSVPESVEHPRRCAEVNIVGTEVVVSAAARAGAERVMFAASAAAYGNEPELPCREDHAPDAWSPYAASKIAGEQILKAHARSGSLSTASLRYFNVYGPKQDPASAYAAVISAFIDRLASGRRVTIFGDGGQTRDFVYVGDVVRANLLAATSDRPLLGETMNIGTGRAVTLLELESTLRGLIDGAAGEPEHAEPRAGDVRHSCAHVQRARELIGFEARVPLADGLAHTVRWAFECARDA